ncbi:MAG: glycosyltransferase [Lutibacter sp.]|nr:glycosyltransferase [Lutibacter sp.]
MLDFPKVTIIVVSFNHSKFIKECLCSIKNQSYSNLELIIADDASNDNSVEVIEEWLQENKISAITKFHKVNTGLATMLNECIEYVDGKYIKLLAADDFLHPESIQKSVKKLEDLGNEYGMVFTDTFAVDEKSNQIDDIADYNKLGNVDKFEFRNELVKGNRIAALTVLMRTEVLKETGYYNPNILLEDYFKWLQINEKYFIGYIPEKLSYYRIHENNISMIKENQINFEVLYLQILFDKKGFLQKRIKNELLRRYLNKNYIPKYIVKAYQNYQYRNNRLNIALKFKIPTIFYKVANKIL